jgi:hypothetical protein
MLHKFFTSITTISITAGLFLSGCSIPYWSDEGDKTGTDQNIAAEIPVEEV